MRIDQLDGLVAFRCVAQVKSFTSASAQLEVSPQAVSQSIKALEARLGVRLFNRTTRSVGLTEAGERLWAQVGSALQDLFEATEAVQDFRDRPAGLLRLAVSRPSFSGLLQHHLMDFHQAYPDIKVELSFDDGFVDITERGLDAGIRLGDSIAQDMVSVRLTESEPIAILASPDYLKAHGVPKDVGDLTAHNCIRFRFPSTGAIFRWELLVENKLVEMEVGGPCTVNDTASMLTLALEGIGLAYVLASTAQHHVKSGALKQVLKNASPVLPGFHLYYTSRRQLPMKLRCFVDFMRKRAP
jgi:DNA-binding transcriptional LysR family regulator